MQTRSWREREREREREQKKKLHSYETPFSHHNNFEDAYGA